MCSVCGLKLIKIDCNLIWCIYLYSPHSCCIIISVIQSFDKQHNLVHPVANYYPSNKSRSQPKTHSRLFGKARQPLNWRRCSQRKHTNNLPRELFTCGASKRKLYTKFQFQLRKNSPRWRTQQNKLKRDATRRDVTQRNEAKARAGNFTQSKEEDATQTAIHLACCSKRGCNCSKRVSECECKWVSVLYVWQLLCGLHKNQSQPWKSNVVLETEKERVSSSSRRSRRSRRRKRRRSRNKKARNAM